MNPRTPNSTLARPAGTIRPLALLALLAAFAIGASADLVTGHPHPPAFDALAAKVGQLEARYAMLDIRVKALEKDGNPLVPVRAAPAPTPGQLVGRDLEAWKVAVITADKTASGSSQLVAYPMAQYMKRYTEDDYSFLFLLADARNRRSQTLTVFVTDYGDEGPGFFKGLIATSKKYGPTEAWSKPRPPSTPKPRGGAVGRAQGRLDDMRGDARQRLGR